MTASLDATQRKTEGGRRWPLWLGGAALGLGAAALGTGDTAHRIANFVVERVIEPFSQIALLDFLCL